MTTSVAPPSGLSQRVRNIKDFLLQGPSRLDVERLRFLEDVYRDTEGQPSVLRRARLFERALTRKTLFIDDNPIVGTVTQYPAGVYAYPEFACGWMEHEPSYMDHLGHISVAPEDRAALDRAITEWRSKGVWAVANRDFSQKYNLRAGNFVKTGVWADNLWFPQGFCSLDYPLVINYGLLSLIDCVETLRRRPELSDKQQTFYEAALICLRAVLAWAGRYAALARQMAENEADPALRNELLDMARVCDRVPAYPARTFREAVQSFWFVHVAAQIEQSACGYSPGRMGQYLQPFYARDKEQRRITSEEAIELLEFLFLRILEIGLFQPESFVRSNLQTGHSISLGGLTPDGTDATTELDYLLLETQRRLRLPQPSLTVFYHEALPEDFLLQCVELIRTGVGQPQFLGNDAAVRRLMDLHPELTVEEARTVCNVSCVPTKVSGSLGPALEATFNLAKPVELALFNGNDPLTSVQVGPETGENFSTYKGFLAAVKEQIKSSLFYARKHGQNGAALVAEMAPLPFRSTMVQDCLGRGKEILDGGAKYSLSGCMVFAGVDAGNSLAAVKKLVFEDKKVTLPQLKEALLADFQGHEDIQRLCLSAPKYGNSDDYADSIVRDLYAYFWEEHQKIGPDYLGRPVKPECYSVSIHNYIGEKTGALPSGRRARLPLTDASVSATPGTDRNGPTALLCSAAGAVDTVKYGSNHLNMKFHPVTLEGKDSARKLLALVRTYMQMGGSHVQFNCVSADTLKAAQKDPQQYRDLVVRVAGFSAFFVLLEKRIQDEIIKRTEIDLG